MSSFFEFVSKARIQLSASSLAFLSNGCDHTEYSTQVGEHVVYHWDVAAWAAEDEQLCAGTVKAADRFVAGIANHYGWTLPEHGPTIEYFWDRGLIRGCGSSACTRALLASAQVFTYQPFDTHELAHTAKGGHGHSTFINEAFAARWQSGVVGMEFTFRTTTDFLTEDQLRAQLELVSGAQVDDYSAYTWWVALETTYGPAKMAEFIAELHAPSVHDAERAVQQVFGISLAESAALADNFPDLVIDDPACELVGLPTLVWNEDEPLVLDHGDSHCDDDDLISIEGQRASWLVALEFPETAVDVRVHVTVPDGDFVQKTLALAMCDGKLSSDLLFDDFPSSGPDAPGWPWRMGGRNVASVIGVIAPDGSVDFPTVLIEETQP